MARDATAKAEAKASKNDIINSSGALIGGFSAAYLAGVPLTTWLAKPDGMLEKATTGIVNAITGGTGPTDRAIPALAALYIFWTWGATGAFSAAGQAMARKEGLDNNAPRQHVSQLRGLPLRLYSAHNNLLESFSGFAVAAALAQAIAPKNQVLVNLLGLHVIAKAFVYYPAYILDLAPPRTIAHVLAIGSAINVCYRLATGAA